MTKPKTLPKAAKPMPVSTKPTKAPKHRGANLGKYLHPKKG